MLRLESIGDKTPSKRFCKLQEKQVGCIGAPLEFAAFMKISVITVCFNSAVTIINTLGSVAAQRHADVEHIIIDGGSTDGTVEIVRDACPRPAKIVSEPDLGIYDAMNKGMAAASGEVVGTLNSDDVFAGPGVLESVCRCFSDPSVNACYGDLVYVARDEPDRIVRYWKSTAYRDGLFSRGWMPPHPTFYLRRSALEKYGGFDLRYRLQADFEFTMRMLAVHRLKSIYLPEIMVKMKTGGVTNNRLTNVVKGNIEAYRACRMHRVNVTPFFIFRKVISRLYQFTAHPKKTDIQTDRT